jgi:toxin ParE1/3/4
LASLQYTRRAALELRAIRRWVAVDSGEDRADGVLQRLTAAMSLLAEQPLIGRERPEIALGLRSFPVWPYVIFYRPQAGGCRIMRVVHGHQDLGRAFGRPERGEP